MLHDTIHYIPLISPNSTGLEISQILDTTLYFIVYGFSLLTISIT